MNEAQREAWRWMIGGALAGVSIAIVVCLVALAWIWLTRRAR